MNIKQTDQCFLKSQVFYVTSDSGADDHAVVYAEGTYFCDCRDFFNRHLPLYGTSGFSLCKHGEFVRDKYGDFIEKRGLGKKSKKFRVWYSNSNFKGAGFWSDDVPGFFDTYEEAQAEINRICGDSGSREVREIEV